ncbi:MAG: hypothetical protein K6F50_08180 [Kiritimatiellae bacterium]|nr:hypothetical protein [Kiritimatiellia bacterium]
MKKILMMGIAALAGLAATGVDAMTLAEAGAKKAEAAANQKTMSAVIKDLSEEDQVKFLAMVNEEIANSEGSAEEKTARYIAAAEAALSSCPKSNVAALTAEVYATVPLQSLPLMSERLASGVFSRGTANDAQVKTAAESVMKAIEARTSSAADSDRRNTAAVLAFLNASGGTPADLRSTLLDGYPSEASMEWVPAAMGEVDGTKDYKPLLGVETASPKADDVFTILPMAPAVLAGSMMADLSGTGTAYTDAVLDPDQYALPDQGGDFGMEIRIPRTTDQSKPWYNGAKRGESYDEPEVYPGQSF